MQKIFINKDTNMVEQILSVNSYDELPDNYFSNCYPIKDDLDNIKGYNLRYNKEKEIFEEVEGIPALEEVKVEKTDNEEIEKIKAENKELRAEIEEIKNLLTVKEVI